MKNHNKLFGAGAGAVVGEVISLVAMLGFDISWYTPGVETMVVALAGIAGTYLARPNKD